MNVVRQIHIRMRTTAKCSLVSLRGHTLKRPFTVSYKRANVTISLSEEIHFINVVRPGTQFQLADLANKFKTAIKLSMKSDHNNLWPYFQVRIWGGLLSRRVCWVFCWQVSLFYKILGDAVVCWIVRALDSRSHRPGSIPRNHYIVVEIVKMKCLGLSPHPGV